MRVIVFGGTRFVGLSLVEQLVDQGHAVAVVHRGQHEPERLPAVEHIHAERSSLGDHRQELLRFKPDAAVDMAAMTAADVRAVAGVLDASIPFVAASSADVYRACAAVYEGRVTDPVPLAEDAALREVPPPDRNVVPPGWDYDAGSYEKLDVEQIYLDRGATVCRLPVVYGEGTTSAARSSSCAGYGRGASGSPSAPGASSGRGGTPPSSPAASGSPSKAVLAERSSTWPSRPARRCGSGSSRSWRRRAIRRSWCACLTSTCPTTYCSRVRSRSHGRSTRPGPGSGWGGSTRRGASAWNGRFAGISGGRQRLLKSIPISAPTTRRWRMLEGVR